MARRVRHDMWQTGRWLAHGCDDPVGYMRHTRLHASLEASPHTAMRNAPTAKARLPYGESWGRVQGTCPPGPAACSRTGTGPPELRGKRAGSGMYLRQKQYTFQGRPAGGFAIPGHHASRKGTRVQNALARRNHTHSAPLPPHPPCGTAPAPAAPSPPQPAVRRAAVPERG